MKSHSQSHLLYKKYEPYVLKVTPFRTPVIVKGNGNTVWDEDNNQYLDMMSGQFCLAFGHNYTPLNEVITKQLKKIAHTNTLSLTKEVFLTAKELASLTKNKLKKTILLSTGAEAVECALRYAKFYTKKNGIVGIETGYHGLTNATQSISTGGIYASPRVPESYSIPSPNWLERPKGITVSEFIQTVLHESREKLKSYQGSIAAFVVEPVISVGGMIFPPQEYFDGIQHLAKEHKALLIFDECQTGLGRTGKWFGYQHYNIVPDMLVLAKISGAGLPVSAVMMSDQIAKEVEGKFIHFSSHQNDPLSGAILNFVITHMREKDILKQINARGKYLLKQLEKLSKTDSWIKHPRGLGLMVGFDLPPELFTEKLSSDITLIDILEENGVMVQAIQKGRTFRVLPSYLISEQEIDFFIHALADSLATLHRHYEKQSR